MAREEVPPGAVVHLPSDVRAIRARLKLTEPAFARRFDLSLGTVREWEQGRAANDQAARVLRRVIETEPTAVERALGR